MNVEETPEYLEMEEWAKTFAFKQYGIAVQALSVLRQKNSSIWNGSDEDLEVEARRIAKKRLSEQVNALTVKPDEVPQS